MGHEWIGKRYRQEYEALAKRIANKVIFGDGDLEIVPYQKSLGQCYYDKCDRVQDRNVLVRYREGDTTRQEGFHVHCFDRLVLENSGKKEKKPGKP